MDIPGIIEMYEAKVHEHLKERGPIHNEIGSSAYYMVYSHVVERHVCRKHHLC